MAILYESYSLIVPDIYHAIPAVRQQGLRLILSHQSFSQVIQGDIELKVLVW